MKKLCFDIISLFQCSPLYFAGYFFTSMAVFLLHLFIIFVGVGLPAYFSNHSPFLREHNFVGFNEFPSLMCWCSSIITSHRGLLFRDGSKDSHSIRLASKCMILEPKQFDSIRIRIDQPSNVSIHNSK